MMRAPDEATAVVLDMDQAELALNPTRTRVWAPSGVPWLVATPGDNRTQVLFGALTSRTGQTPVLHRPHKRSADFQACVEHVLIPAYPAADFLFLIVDGSSIYTAKSTQHWLAQRPQIVLVPLPSDAPRLNLQEHIWRWMRAAVTHHHFFGTFGALITAAGTPADAAGPRSRSGATNRRCAPSRCAGAHRRAARAPPARRTEPLSRSRAGQAARADHGVGQSPAR
jgi:hypothetical protein